MPAAIPPRFVSVDTAKSTQGYYNLIGVVVDCLPKSKTGGTSFVVTFTIKDADYGKGNQSWTGLKIKYFNNNEHCLPDLRVNDVILLRRLRVRLHQGSLLGVASNSDNVPWAVFRQPEGRELLGTPACSPGSSALSLEETTYANWLLDSLSRSRSRTSSTPVTWHRGESSTTPSVKQQTTAVAKKRDRFSLIKNLSMDTFVDLTVHVVKTWYQDDRVHLYVTDYTVNKSLFDYQEKSDNDGDGDGNGVTFGDEFGFMTRSTREKKAWAGPKGRMTVQITLWDPHSTYARENVREDSYVALTNVHVKMDKLNGIVEGAIHTDKLYPHKVGIRVLEEDDDEPRFAELKQRKREYWRQNKMNKRKATEDFGGEDGGPKKNAKKRRKEQQRLRKQQEQRQKQLQQQRREDGQTEIPIAMIPAKGPNPHIQAKDPSRACRKLSEILTNESHNISLPGNFQYRLPFQNVKYRTVVRVVDFHPPDIADFAVPYKPRRYSASSPSSSSEDEDDITPHTAGIRWEWRFYLLVEDDKTAPGQARDRVKLFVSGAEAEFLLKLDAVNLRKNRGTLNRLKEKLFILWGDLEEYKNGGMRNGQQKGPSQRPFTCCIKEYGVRCACQRKVGLRDGGDSDSNGVVVGPEHNQHCLGWERRFALFGTTINE